jgi:hypothetical protein
LQSDRHAFAGTINAQIKRITGKQFDATVIRDALSHTEFSTDPGVESFQRFLEMGKTVGIIRSNTPDLDTLVEDHLLKKVLKVEHSEVENGLGTLANDQVQQH